MSDPDAPFTLTKASGETAVHEHPVPDVTLTEMVVDPPAESNEALLVLSEKLHEDCGGGVGVGGVDGGVEPGALCVSVIVEPAMTSEAVRAAPLFSERRTSTVPLPVPLLPDTISANDASLAAVHAQFAAVVMVIETEPALEGRVLRGLLLTTEYEHVAGVEGADGVSLGSVGDPHPLLLKTAATMKAGMTERTLCLLKGTRARRSVTIANGRPSGKQ